MTLYNEIDPFAAEWLRNLIDAGEITHGVVDERSIADLAAADIAGLERVHLFAGIAGWELALNLAGWTGPVWTGSCPCQPFSSAGKRKGTADERHLWPEMFRLIRECRPPVVFGEQVSGKSALGWLDGVFADLEGEGYTCGAVIAGAHSVGAPHIRQRLFWVADAGGSTSERDTGRFLASKAGVDRAGKLDGRLHQRPANGGDPQPRGLADARQQSPRNAVSRSGVATGNGSSARRTEAVGESGRCSGSGGLGDSECDGLRIGGRPTTDVAHESGNWSVCRAIPCRDGKHRRISSQSGDEPLANGLPRQLGPAFAGLGTVGVRAARRNRVGRLKGYGNAIVPQLAAEFVRAYMESRP